MKSSLVLHLQLQDYKLKSFENLVWNLEILSEILKSQMKSWNLWRSPEIFGEISKSSKKSRNLLQNLDGFKISYAILGSVKSFEAVLMLFCGWTHGGREGDTFMMKFYINLTADHTEFFP